MSLPTHAVLSLSTWQPTQPLTPPAKCAAQLTLLWGLGFGVNLLVTRFGLPFSGNAVAMLAVVALLACGALRVEWLDPAASILVRHLALFFVPFAVDILRSWQSLASDVLPLAAILIVSVAGGIVSAGLVVQFTQARSVR
jgi:holin-like protein